jgi:hypothetical protein
MTFDHARAIAIEALRRQAQRLATDANLHDMYHANHPAAINASRKRHELLEAVDTLQAGPLAGMPELVGGDWSGYETCTICGNLVRYDIREAHFQVCQAAWLADEVPVTQ